MQPGPSPRVVSVRGGAVQPTGSWLYVWIHRASTRVVYVGATGLDPELRAHLHLSDDNPDIGRVRRLVPDAAHGDFDILAFALPSGISRPRAKAALVAALAKRGLFAGDTGAGDELEELTVPMTTAIARHMRQLA